MKTQRIVEGMRSAAFLIFLLSPLFPLAAPLPAAAMSRLDQVLETLTPTSPLLEDGTATPTPTPEEPAAPAETPTPEVTLTETPSPEPAATEIPTDTPTSTPTPEPLEAPQLLEPAGEIESARPVYRWTVVDGASQYTLRVSGTEGKLLQVTYETAEVCQATQCEAQPDLPLVDGVYRWQAQAANAETEGAWSELLEFVVGTPAPALRVEASLSPGRVSAGETVTMQVSVQNLGSEDAGQVRLRNALPEGFAYEAPDGPNPAFHLEEGSGELVADLGTLRAGESQTLTYQLVVSLPDGSAPQAVRDVLQVSAAGLEEPVLAETTLLVLPKDAQWGPLAPGYASAMSTSRAQVDVPAGSYNGRGELILMRPVRENPSDGRQTGILTEFRLEVLAAPLTGPSDLAAEAAPLLAQSPPADADPERQAAHLSGALDTRQLLAVEEPSFDAPVQLTIRFDGLADLSALWADREPFVAVWSEDDQVWVQQSIVSVGLTTNSVVVESTHFSTWGAGIGGTFPTNGTSIPLYDEAAVAGFKGSASYSYPLWVPAGRGAVAPSLSLSYSSGMVDGILGDVQSPWVGMGWNIDAIEITRLITTNEYAAGFKNEFLLTFNGTGYKLIEDPTYPGRYYTEDQSFLYIQRHNPPLGNEQVGGTPPPNETQEWWEIVAADGTRYRLGWNPDSEQRIVMAGYHGGSKGNPVLENGPASTWDATAVTGVTVLPSGDGSYRLWYAGFEGGSPSIGAATGGSPSAWTRVAPYDPRVLEAEEGVMTDPMVIAADSLAASCNYVSVPPAAVGSQVDVTFDLAQSQTVYLWGRAKGGSYSVWVDDGTPQTWTPSGTTTFLWNKLPPTTGFSLTADSHTLHVKTLTAGGSLDAFYVASTSAETPPSMYCSSAPVLRRGVTGAWDDYEVLDPEVVKVGGTYHLWYTGRRSTTAYEIGHATSTDGLTWVKDANPVFLKGNPGTFDSVQVRQPTVIHDGADFHMWYTGYNGTTYRIGYARSSDGVNWTVRQGPLTLGGTAWSDTGPFYPEVLWDAASSRYLLWYVDTDTADKLRVASAATNDPLSWTAGQTNPVLTASGWMGTNLESPSVVFDGTTYHVWFVAGSSSQDIGYGYTTGDPAGAGTSWTVPAANTTGRLYADYAGEAFIRVAQRWRVDRVTDLHGNTTTYSYTEETRTPYGEEHDLSSYLSRIRYTGSGGEECNPTQHACYEIRFQLASRETEDPNDPEDNDFEFPVDMPQAEDTRAWDTWDKSYLDEVRIYALSGTNETLLRTYDLGYEELTRTETVNGETVTWDSLILTTITTSAPTPGGGTLYAPRMTFSYTVLDNRANSGDPEWPYPRLTGLDNGTEGTVALAYVNDGRPYYEYYAWRIDYREGRDGVTGDVRRTDYTYGPACYNGLFGWCNPYNRGSLVGHPWMTEAVQDFDRQVLSSTQHYYHTDQRQFGREYRTETLDSRGDVYFASETTYQTIDRTNNAAYPDGVRFMYACETRQYERQGGVLGLLTRTEYSYDPQWGDLLRQALYTEAGDGTACNNDGTPHTTTVYDYLENVALPGTFLHSFPRSAITYEGSETGTVLSARYSAYDNIADGLGTMGQLTLQQTRTLATPGSTQTLDVTYDYDNDDYGDTGYGNLIATRAHGEYGVIGTLPTHNDTLDRVSTVTYDSTYHSYPVSSTNPLNQTAYTLYDFEVDLNNPDKRPPGENPPIPLPLGLPMRTRDPNLADSWTEYDALGRPILSWQHGSTQANVITDFSVINDQANASAHQVSAPYTIRLQIWDSTASLYREAWAFYDGWGRILRTVGPAEDAGQYIQADTWYNAFGQAGKSARPYEVTLATPPGSWSAPNWATTAHTVTTFDDLGRAIRVTAPGNLVARTQYDGRITTTFDPNNHKRVSLTDDLGRLVEVKEFTGSGTLEDPYAEYANMLYTYDTRGLLRFVTDDAGNVTEIRYDGLGRKVYMDDPDMGVWTYSYDLWGQLDVQTDARGAQIRFAYDKLGRVTQREAKLSGGGWSTVAAFSYDSIAGGNQGIGRLTGMVSYDEGRTLANDTLVYNLLGQVTSTSRQVDVDENGTYDYTFTSGSTYDSLGRVMTQTLPDPDGSGVLTTESLAYTYNARGLFESLSGDDNYEYVSATTYTPMGTVDTQYLADDPAIPGANIIHQNFYEQATQRLIGLQVRDASAGNLLYFTYTYDKSGNILSINDTVRSETSLFGYDDLDRLTYARVSGPSGVVEERAYDYNTLGNLTSFSLTKPGFVWGHITPGADITSGMRGAFNPIVGSHAQSQYVAGQTIPPPQTGSNRLDYTYPASGPTSVRPHAVTGLSNGNSYGYDANGNMTTRIDDGVTWTHTFDAENRLTRVTDGTTTTDYIYDGNGSRLMRRIGATTTLYVMGMELDLTVDVVAHTHSWTKATVYYPMGGAFRVYGGSEAGFYYRHGDHLGSTSLITDATGSQVGDRVVYAPFGEIREGTLDPRTDFGFTGQRLDRSTDGLMYYGARYYLPELRRFISADSIVPGAGNPQTFNRYSYSYNNALKYTDPSGHAPEEYSEQWWIDRYYALQLWKFEDPGHDIHTEDQFVEFLRGILEEDYDVKLHDVYDLANPLLAVHSIYWAVTVMGEAFQGVGTTFQEVFGDSHDIYLSTVPNTTACGKTGDGSAILNCNTGGMNNGATIYLTEGGFNSYTITHEFGHMFTQGRNGGKDGWAGDQPRYDFLYNDPTTASDNKQFSDRQWMASQNVYNYASPNVSRLTHAEATANVFTAWVFDTYLDGSQFTANEAEREINEFMMGVIGQ